MKAKVFLAVVAIVAALGIAGTMDYTESVIYNMSQEVYDGIVADNPDLTQKEIADYYLANKENLDRIYNYESKKIISSRR